MKTFRILIRTFMDTIVILACMRLQVNSDMSGNMIDDKTLHRANYSDSNENRENSVRSDSGEPVRDGRSHEEAYLQNYSGSVELGSHALNKKIADGVFSGNQINSHGYEATTSVTLSTLSSSLPSTTFSKFDTFRSVPYTYFKIMNSSHSHQGHADQKLEAEASKLQIIVGVLLPFTGSRPFVVKKVSPAIEQAVDKMATEMGPWNFHRLVPLLLLYFFQVIMCSEYLSNLTVICVIQFNHNYLRNYYHQHYL